MYELSPNGPDPEIYHPQKNSAILATSAIQFLCDLCDLCDSIRPLRFNCSALFVEEGQQFGFGGQAFASAHFAALKGGDGVGCPHRILDAQPLA